MSGETKVWYCPRYLFFILFYLFIFYYIFLTVALNYYSEKNNVGKLSRGLSWVGKGQKCQGNIQYHIHGA